MFSPTSQCFLNGAGLIRDPTLVVVHFLRVESSDTTPVRAPDYMFILPHNILTSGLTIMFVVRRTMSDFEDYGFESDVGHDEVDDAFEGATDIAGIGEEEPFDEGDVVGAGEDDAAEEEEEEEDADEDEQAEVELGDEDTDEENGGDEDDYEEEEEDDDDEGGDDNEGEDEEEDGDDEELGTAALVQQDLIADDPDDYEEEPAANEEDDEEVVEEDEDEDDIEADNGGEPDTKKARIE